MASGAALATALRMLLLEVNVLQLSAILSSVNLVAYAGSAVTGLVCGALLGATSYAAVFAVMAFVLAAACVFVFSAARTAPARRKSKRLTLAHFHRKCGTAMPASEDTSAGASEDLPAPMLS